MTAQLMLRTQVSCGMDVERMEVGICGSATVTMSELEALLK